MPIVLGVLYGFVCFCDMDFVTNYFSMDIFVIQLFPCFFRQMRLEMALRPLGM